MINKTTKKHQKGAESLEFLVVFFLYMVLILAVFDFGRALYVWNALTEATRRGARMAVVCPLNDPNIRRAAIFDTLQGQLTTSPIIKDLQPGHIDINYFQIDGSVATNAINTRFAQVSINNGFTFQFLIPGLNQVINVPNFRTTLYAESKGAVPFFPGEIQNSTVRCSF